jgi:galactose mutarotase-like enzyme
MRRSNNKWNAYIQPFDLTAITAPDGSITAKFVSFGATLTELWVKDKHGEPRDVVLGYDDNVRPPMFLGSYRTYAR